MLSLCRQTDRWTTVKQYAPDLSIRGHNKCNLKTEIPFGMSDKHCGKRRKCWLPAFSPLPTMFSKAFFSKGVKVQIVWERVKITSSNN